MTSDTPFHNPFEEGSKGTKMVDPCTLIIFGATGDLTSRKLVPALYNLAREGQLPAHFILMGFARRVKTDEEFREEMLAAVNAFSRVRPVDPLVWNAFREKIFYHVAEFHDDQGYQSLASRLKDLELKFQTQGNRVFYLSTPPSYFPTITEKLKTNALVYNRQEVKDKWSRIIIEKPFGNNFDSAQALQTQITKSLDESQIYRIDHYLGKETVQNLLLFRFSNPIFESIWNNRHIDHIQITVSEEIGIGSRGKFFEESGILRDIVANHMMQLLSVVGMEPPASFEADAIRDEKVKVLQTLRPFPKHDLNKTIVRGQYGPGFIKGSSVKGYRQEANVSQTSSIETYVAMRLFVDNWRWDGVTFYLRAGKRLPKRSTEIAIIFKDPPGFIFKPFDKKISSNVLVIRIQPDEGISLKMNCKVPGMNGFTQPVKMDFRYGSYFGEQPPEAYERLICDCINGDSTLFARIDEVMTSWKLFTPVLQKWEREPTAEFPNYEAGSWGPKEADLLIWQDGKHWRTL